jgi:putative hydrolase of the HAD superfamily
MKNIKALIFDLDNTILDRSATFLNFSNKLIDEYFTDLTDKEKPKIIEQIIVTDQDGYKEKKQMFIELLEILPWNNKPSVEELLEFYTSEYVSSAILMEDALEILQFFKTKYKIGLITNGKIIIQYGKLDKLNLREYFDTIVV